MPNPSTFPIDQLSFRIKGSEVKPPSTTADSQPHKYALPLFSSRGRERSRERQTDTDTQTQTHTHTQTHIHRHRHTQTLSLVLLPAAMQNPVSLSPAELSAALQYSPTPGLPKLVSWLKHLIVTDHDLSQVCARAHACECELSEGNEEPHTGKPKPPCH